MCEAFSPLYRGRAHPHSCLWLCSKHLWAKQGYSFVWFVFGSFWRNLKFCSRRKEKKIQYFSVSRREMLLEMKHLFSFLRSETDILTFLPILRREREIGKHSSTSRGEREKLKDNCVFQELKYKMRCLIFREKMCQCLWPKPPKLPSASFLKSSGSSAMIRCKNHSPLFLFPFPQWVVL